MTTVLADSLPTALLALIAPTTVRTPTACLATRAVLHPVLARPLCVRAPLPLRALLGRLLSRCIRVLCIADIRNRYPDSRPPNRRHPHPRGRRTLRLSRHKINRALENIADPRRWPYPGLGRGHCKSRGKGRSTAKRT